MELKVYQEELFVICLLLSHHFGIMFELSFAGKYLNATKQTQTFQQYDVQLSIEGPDKYKPGLPYNGKVIKIVDLLFQTM